MSYDLTIRADEGYSRSVPVQSVSDFIRRLSSIRPNGDRSFVLDDRTKRWMEIDLEMVSPDGDNMDEEGEEYSEFNCIRLQIPHQGVGGAPAREYFPTALAIAGHLGWRLYDEQSGDEIPQGVATAPAAPKIERRGWWKFWA